MGGACCTACADELDDPEYSKPPPQIRMAPYEEDLLGQLIRDVEQPDSNSRMVTRSAQTIREHAMYIKQHWTTLIPHRKNVILLETKSTIDALCTLHLKKPWE